MPDVNPSDSTRGAFRLKVLQQPPAKLATIAGDVVHNLRSSLDYIIDELVRKNGHSPTFQSMFPICADPKSFTQAMDKGRLYGVHERAVRAIDGFQPYQVKSEARRRHPLLHLHKLSNRDKHHMLALSALNGSFVWGFVDPASGRVLSTNETTEPIRDGQILAEVPIDFMIDGTKAQLQSQLTITICFEEPEFIGFDVLGCLQTIREFIGKYMVPAFALFFEPLPNELVLTIHGLPTPPDLPADKLIAAVIEQAIKMRKKAKGESA